MTCDPYSKVNKCVYVDINEESMHTLIIIHEVLWKNTLLSWKKVDMVEDHLQSYFKIGDPHQLTGVKVVVEGENSIAVRGP